MPKMPQIGPPKIFKFSEEEYLICNFDETLQSRHSRENRSRGNFRSLKHLDSDLRQNDENASFQAFYEIIEFHIHFFSAFSACSAVKFLYV